MHGNHCICSAIRLDFAILCFRHVSAILLEAYSATRALVSVFVEKELVEIAVKSVMLHTSISHLLGAFPVNVAQEV